MKQRKTIVPLFALPAAVVFAAVVACICFTSCLLEENNDVYVLVPPELPAAWQKALGEPRWILEWVDEDGNLQQKETATLDGEHISPYRYRAVPISASPVWKEKGISAGQFYGAGAIFPQDAADGKITLTWQGGVDAHFYKLLAELDNEKRLPANFDWKRFRELFTGEKTEKEARSDPWLVPWKEIAQKTAESGFSSTRIKVKKDAGLPVTVPAGGPWLGGSPFTPCYDWKMGETVTVSILKDVENFYCPQGVLRCVKNAYIFRKY
ncbi:MAG: hypothetical protein LBG72_03470 [Spirochaetaceae bacterium]|jgi:hypothetical protein|nr:hypothetical protein [Spirochaetaceae bacterium]